MLSEPIDQYTPIVARFLNIDNVTWGEPKKSYIVRYRGHLLGEDSATAYDELSGLLRSLNITPLFRKEEGVHAIVLIPAVTRPRPSKTWIPIFMFILTVFSVLFAGTIYAYKGPVTDNFMESLGIILRNLSAGIPFAVSLLAILLAHEFGHYLIGKYHGTVVTLPYFIPFPLSYFGTMGAFIQLKETPKNKRILLDIGLAGPIAGLVVAIPILILGLYLSELNRIPYSVLPGGLEGNSILYLLLKYVVYGEWLPKPVSYNGLAPLLYWARYIFTGFPLPRGGMDVTLHPVAWAGWAGLLVTALNLIPAGQLDGGHIVYTLMGRRAAKLLPFILASLVLLGMVWSGWWLWALIIFFLGRIYAEPLDQITPLDKNRKLLAVLGIIVFILVFIPVPLL